MAIIMGLGLSFYILFEGLGILFGDTVVPKRV